MQDEKCRYCGSQDVRVRNIEIRQINSRTMALCSKENVRELECNRCGYVLSLSGMAPALA